ncbi:MAG: S9 family peptidase [Clostridia bacterium]|nr:S9 family peptidase [Clostridia bacterium]
MSRFTPQDLWRFSSLSCPALSPSGKLCAVVLSRPDPDGTSHPRVRVYDTQSAALLYETPGALREKQPVWSGDGCLFLLSDETGDFQVTRLTDHLHTRETLTTLRRGVDRFDVKGHRLALACTLYPDDLEGGLALHPMKQDEKAAWAETIARRPYVAEDLTCKMDEWYGMRKGEQSYLFTQDLGTGAVTRLPFAFECVCPRLSQDGERLAFLCYPHAGAQGRQAEVAVSDLTGENLRLLTEGTGLFAQTLQAPVFSGDGRYLFAPLLHELEGQMSPQVVRFALDAGDAPDFFPDLTAEDDCEGVGEMVASRTDLGSADSVIALQGDDLLFLGAFRGRSILYRMALSPDARPVPVDVPGAHPVEFSVSGSSLAVLSGTDSRPAELYVNGVQLTHIHDWLPDMEVPETLTVHIPEGESGPALDYFISLPPHATGPVPAVLDIKGGPETMQTAAYWHEFHALNAAGFAVIRGNPRGSSGYGRAFRAGGVCWTDSVVDDLLRMCHDAAEKGLIDPERVGVTGGSYGSYMTVKLISKTKYFRAAVAQRVFVNPGTSYGTGDMGFVSAGEIPKRFTMLSYLTDRARGSNISRVDAIDTPLLILHGYRDYRCTFEQAEQLFVAMKERRRDVPVRLVMFPKENHALTRTGNMKAQVRHLQEIVEWFVKYLAYDTENTDSTDTTEKEVRA